MVDDYRIGHQVVKRTPDLSSPLIQSRGATAESRRGLRALYFEQLECGCQLLVPVVRCHVRAPEGQQLEYDDAGDLKDPLQNLGPNRRRCSTHGKGKGPLVPATADRRPKGTRTCSRCGDQFEVPGYGAWCSVDCRRAYFKGYYSRRKASVYARQQRFYRQPEKRAARRKRLQSWSEKNWERRFRRRYGNLNSVELELRLVLLSLKRWCRHQGYRGLTSFLVSTNER